MKKLCTLFLALAACVGTMFASTKIGNLYYNLDASNQTAEVTYGEKYSGSIVIPKSVTHETKTYSVTSIGNLAFSWCSDLTSVTIPNSITSISTAAFRGCSSLTSVIIPNSVTSIGNNVFSDCIGLTSVTIPNSVTTIGNEAFYYCTGLTSVKIPDSVTSIGYGAFTDCKGLTSIVIPNSVKSIEEGLFNRCTNLTSVTIPNSVTSIGNGGFLACSNLTSVTIPNSVTSIGDGAFGRCTGLTSITMLAQTPPSLVSNAFENCTILNSIYVPCGTMENYRSAWSEYSSLIKYAPHPYKVTVTKNEGGNVTEKIVGETICDESIILTLTATANTGYHFSKWSDGDINNPRTVILTQDTAFTAEFAKAKYTISTVVNDNARGTTSGDAEVEYLTSLKLIATANYGYHFDHWQSGTKTYTANPLNITATGNATYTAYFMPNTYNISVYSNNQKQGSVSAPTQANYLNTITLTATPADGCHFVQWSDGNTTNPRYIQITQDTTFTADFAITTSGLCGDNLTWSYRSNKLTIGGSGAMYSYTATTAPWHLLVNGIYTVVIPEGLTEISSNAFNNCQNLTSVIWNAVNCAAPTSEADAPFYAIRTKIRSFAFGESVKKVPAYLCYEMSAINSITLGSNVTNIGKHAFESCEDLASITCEASIPPTCGTDAFAGVSIFIPVHVPHLSIDKYAKAPIWKEFDAFSSIQAENKSVEEVTATATENSVTMEWPADEDAEIYTIVIERNGVKFCELSFNANGQLLGISFAPSRNGALYTQAAVQTATGWQFTITSLESGTTYNYCVTAKKEDETPLYTKSGSFKTIGTATAIDQTSQEPIANSQKLIKDGQILILRGDKTYTLQGQEMK